MDKVTEIVDYAYPTMQAEKALKDVHEAALAKNYVEGMKRAIDASKWIMELHAALMVMEQKNK